MVNKAEIQNLLHHYFRWTGRITIQDDGRVDCSDNISLHNKSPHFPVKFGKVLGYFGCRRTNLTSLENSPREVGEFDCSYNNLTSLHGGPETVNGLYDCRGNPLISLQGMPDKIKGKIRLDYKKDLPLLRVLIAEGGVGLGAIEEEKHMTHQIETILNQFAGQGKRGVPSCIVALNNLQKKWGIDLSGNMKW